MSKTKKDSSADSKANETGKNERTKLTQEQIMEGYAVQVNGLTLQDYTDEIRRSWNASTQARLKVGELLCVVVDNKMLEGVDIRFDEYVEDEFSIKHSMAYLLMRIFRDDEVRELVSANGLPLEAASNILSMRNKYGAKARDELVGFALLADGSSKSASVLREKAKSIRKAAVEARKPPAPIGPDAELRAALSMERVLRQEKSRLLGLVKETDAKISVNSAEISRLTEIVKTMTDGMTMPTDEEFAESVKPNATKAAALLATEHDVDLTAMKGSLKNDRISVQDIRDEIASMVLDAKASK